MSFKLKRVVNRIIATCLVTITLLSVVPFGVFAPINTFADDTEIFNITVAKPQKSSDIFSTEVSLTAELLKSNPRLSPENEIAGSFKDSQGGANGMIDTVPSILYYTNSTALGPWANSKAGYLFVPFTDGDILVNNTAKDGSSAVFATTTFTGNDVYIGLMTTTFSGINTSVPINKDDYQKIMNGVSVSGGINDAGGSYTKLVAIKGDWANAMVEGYYKCSPQLLDKMLTITDKMSNIWDNSKIWLRRQKYDEHGKYDGHEVYSEMSIIFSEDGMISLLDDSGKLKVPLPDNDKYRFNTAGNTLYYKNSDGTEVKIPLDIDENKDKLKYDIYVGNDKVKQNSLIVDIYNKGFKKDEFDTINRLTNSISIKLEQQLTKLEENKNIESGEADDSSNPEDANKAVEALEKGQSMQAWMLLINNFFTTGETKISDDVADVYELSPEMKTSIQVMDLLDYGYTMIKTDLRKSEGGGIFDLSNVSAELRGDTSAIDNSSDPDNYKVTPYDDLMIRMYFSIQRQYRYVKDNERRGKIQKTIEDYKFDNKFAVNSTFGASGEDVGYPNYLWNEMDSLEEYNKPEMPETDDKMKSTAKLAAETGFGVLDKDTTPNVKVLAQNFLPAMQYMLYGVLSVNGVNGYGEAPDNTNTIDIPYCESATQVIPSLNLNGGSGNSDSSDSGTTIMTESIDFGRFGLPQLSKVTRIVNNEFSRNKISQIYLSLMYIKKYASIPKDFVEDKDAGTKNWIMKKEESIGGLSTVGEDQLDYEELTKSGDLSKLQNKKIDEFLLKVEETPEDEKSNVKPDKQAGMYIKAYISIHDGMDYIGLSKDDDWVSIELKKIYDYYDDIKEYKDTVATTEYDPADLEATQPFTEFFNLEDSDSNPKTISKYISMGIGASATYLPLVTNTFDYDAISVVDDPDFVEDFHYKYGFHRKALFIDSNSSAALQSYVTGSKDSLKVATLEDFMQPDKDIVLYIDPNFYNIKSLAEKQNLSYAKLQNTEESSKKEQGLLEGVADMWSEWRNLDASSICKTAGANLYSDALGNSAVQAYGTDKQEHNFWEAKSKNHYVLSSDAIDTYYKADEYSDTQSFAFVSGIYRCSALLNICQRESANPKPVFISSPTLPFVEGVSKKEFNSIYNYLMVKNLKANLGLDYKTELDLSSPLFMDVYGNITTQSGLVVIPAASNATLYDANQYSIITAGLASLANSSDAWQIPADANNVEKMIDSGFVKDPNTETYKMQNKSTNTVSNLNMNNLPLQSEKVKKILYNDAYANAGTATVEGDLFNQRVNTIMEVMRGAPIENINFDDEGLSGFRNLDKTGIYIAYRIEQLGDMLLSSSEGNSLLKMPNLAFMEGVEYVVVIVFKILLAAGVFLLWFKLYADGMSNNLGIRTGVEFIVSIASVVIGIVLIPTLINFSYYQTNKQLLQDEAAYLLMLNTEKNAEGKEVGIKEVKAPSSTTKFYIKLNEIKVPWWTVMQDIYSPEMFQTMEQVYEEAYSTSIYSSFDGAMKRGNGIYINTDDLFKSSEIRFIPDDGDNPESEDTGKLVQAVLPNNKMSYVLPYYAIIDSLLANVAEYNDVYKSTAYRTKILQNGNVRTIGLLEPYFKSNLFLNKDEMNLFGFYDMYDIPYSTDFRRTLFTKEDIETMSKSLWYNKDAFTDEEVAAKLEELDQIGKRFIVENRTLLNKVTDETFIKVFALYMSVQHNNLFKVPAARGIELMEIDTKDIIRLSLAPKGDVMHSISMSFGRFTFTQAGTFGTILMAFLLLIYYFTSLIRPVVMIILVGGLIFSYVWKKLMRYEQNHSLEGYIVSCALICLVNIIYALVIKVSVTLPNFGVDPIFSILMQIVLQAAYTGVLYLIGYVVLKNCRDLGYFTYKTFYDAHMANKIQSISMSANKLIAKSIFAPFSHTANNMRNEYLGNRRTAGLTGDDIYNRMQETDEERYNNIENNYRRRY